MQPITDEKCVGNYSITVNMVIQYLIENYEITETDARTLCNEPYYKDVITNGIENGSLVYYVGDQIADDAELNELEIAGEYDVLREDAE